MNYSMLKDAFKFITKISLFVVLPSVYYMDNYPVQ